MTAPRIPGHSFMRPFATATAAGLVAVACGGSGASAPSGEKITCSAPIGAIPKEDCAAVAADFGQFTVGGAVERAGSGKDAAQKLEAIKAVSALAQSIKDQRLKLCDDYSRCRVALDEHDAQDKVLSQALTALVDLWNKRRLSSAADVIRFRESVRALDRRVNGGVEGLAVALQPPRTVKAQDVFTQVAQPDVVFRADGGAVTISASTERERDALETKPDTFTLSSGHRYHVTLGGSYAPAAAPAVRPGDELLVRLSYHATAAGTLAVALRSLEDPDASEANETWSAAAGEKGSKEIKLTADPRQTGFSVAFAATGGPVEVKSLEVLRDGKVVLAARPGDPAMRTDCTAAGPALTCAPGKGDRITLGAPSGYLVMSVRDGSGVKASTRTLSLDGGRSVDAPVGEGARVVVSLVGSGSATLRELEITDLGN